MSKYFIECNSQKAFDISVKDEKSRVILKYNDIGKNNILNIDENINKNDGNSGYNKNIDSKNKVDNLSKVKQSTIHRILCYFNLNKLFFFNVSYRNLNDIIKVNLKKKFCFNAHRFSFTNEEGLKSDIFIKKDKKTFNITFNLNNMEYKAMGDVLGKEYIIYYNKLKVGKFYRDIKNHLCHYTIDLLDNKIKYVVVATVIALINIEDK